MYPEPMTAGFGSDIEVVLTPMMVAVGVMVSLVVEFLKAIVSRWPSVTDAMKKPLFPLVGCVLCMITFVSAGVDEWLLSGIAVGLMTGGGYDVFKGMTAAKQGGTIPNVNP